MGEGGFRPTYDSHGPIWGLAQNVLGLYKYNRPAMASGATGDAMRGTED